MRGPPPVPSGRGRGRGRGRGGPRGGPPRGGLPPGPKSGGGPATSTSAPRDDPREKMKKLRERMKLNRSKANVEEPRANRVNVAKKIKLSKKAKDVGTNSQDIQVNLSSLRRQKRFGRLVVYSLNCLSLLGNNRFNCSEMVDQGGIDIFKEILEEHGSNPDVMRELSLLLTKIANSSPEYAQMIADSGILDLCVKSLEDNPDECGVYAMNIVDAVVRNCPSAASQMANNGHVERLQAVLERKKDNEEVATAIVKTMNLLANTQEGLERMARAGAHRQILEALQLHPNNEVLAINAIEALEKLAKFDRNIYNELKQMGIVPIISTAMQANPYNDLLLEKGANALRLFAGEDDLTRSLNVLLDYTNFTNKQISEALAIVGNLALIAENANYIQGAGGIRALLDLIAFKGRRIDGLTPEELDQIADAVRAVGRLVKSDEGARTFQQNGGVQQLKKLLEGADQSSAVMGACMDLVDNLATTRVGQGIIRDSNLLSDFAQLLAAHPDYNVVMKKMLGVLSKMPNDPAMLAPLVRAGLLQAIQAGILQSLNDPEAMGTHMDMIRQLANMDPTLTQALVDAELDAMMKALDAFKDNPEVLHKILGAVSALAHNDPTIMNKFKQKGLEEKLVEILKNEGVSDETIAAIKHWYDNLVNDGLDPEMYALRSALTGKHDVSDLLADIDASAMTPRGLHAPDDMRARGATTPVNDTAVVLQGLEEFTHLMEDPGFLQTFVSQGQVTNVLNSLEQFQDDPRVVGSALGILTKCATVPGSFQYLEDLGVPDVCIQCLAHHAGNAAVQLEALKALAAIAAAPEPGVVEAICTPYNMDQILQALQANPTPEMAGAFCNLVDNLLKNPNPGVTSSLIAQGVPAMLQYLGKIHADNPGLQAKINQLLAGLDPSLQAVHVDADHLHADVGYGGAVNLSSYDDDALNGLIQDYGTAELVSHLNASKDPRVVQKLASELEKRVDGGDVETMTAVGSGAVPALVTQAHANMGNPQALDATLDALGALSQDPSLKSMLGMHGVIQLVLECMRRNPNNDAILYRCCYILSNLSFQNAQNVESIMQLGGIHDCVGVLKGYVHLNYLAETTLYVLCNVCHNVDKNKVLVCQSGGGEATLGVMHTFANGREEGDADALLAAFRCLANLAFVKDNVNSLVTQNCITIAGAALNNNVHHLDLVQMATVFFANMSSHEHIAGHMGEVGIITLILNVSRAFPDEIEVQRSCLGCWGNLMNVATNTILFVEAGCPARVFEIMDQLSFEASIVSLCLQLLKILGTNADVASSLIEGGAATAIGQVLDDNRIQPEIVQACCQALCKLISSRDSAAHVGRTSNLVDLLISIANENNNFANPILFTDIVKVWVNLSSVEENAHPISKQAGVPILRGIELHAANTVYLNNAAMLLSTLTLFQAASRPLVKRGGIVVITESMKQNMTRRGIIQRYIRTLGNMLLTDVKAADKMGERDTYTVVERCVNEYPTFKPIQDEWTKFQKAMRMRNARLVTKSGSASIRDRMHINDVRALTAGAMMKKYDAKGKGRSRLVRTDDECRLLLFEDPSGKKPPKQLNMRSVSEIRSGPVSNNLRKARPDCAFALFSIDPNGRPFSIDLETTRPEDQQKWVQMLTTLLRTVKSAAEGY